MDITLKRWLAAVAFVAGAGLFADAALAQSARGELDITPPASVNDTVYDVFYEHDLEFYPNRSLAEQIDFLFGIGFGGTGYVENEIWADGANMTRYYQDIFEQQANSDDLIRTADAVNPYQSSLLLIPRLDPPAPIPVSPLPIIPRTSTTPRPGPVPALY